MRGRNRAVRVLRNGVGGFVVALVSGALFPMPASAGSEVYVCTDAQGTRTYQNTGPSDQCRRLNLEPVLSVPQPAMRPAAPAPARTPAQAVDTPAQRAENPGAGSPAVPPAGGQGAAASGKGVWGGDSQSARESDRLRILEAELREEERRLQQLQQRQQTAPDERNVQEIARSLASLDALRREIGKVRRP